MVYLTETRMNHLVRIRGFVTGKFSRSTDLTDEVKEAYETTVVFLGFSIVEVRATQVFAEALASVRLHPSCPCFLSSFFS